MRRLINYFTSMRPLTVLARTELLALPVSKDNVELGPYFTRLAFAEVSPVTISPPALFFKLKLACSEHKKKHLKVLFSSGMLAELLLAKSTKTLVEFINTTTSLSSFLLTSVEWVTF